MSARGLLPPFTKGGSFLEVEIMKMPSERARKILTVALSVTLGFAGGILTKELYDGKNSASASEPAIVKVEKIKDQDVAKFNRLIGKDLWDVYIDPFLLPVDLGVRANPLLPLMSFPLEAPKVQTIDKDNELRVIAQVPGMNENDVKVEAGAHSLTIKAHKKREEKKGGGFESLSESFEQSLHLPSEVNADKVQATVKDGVLTVTLPKKH